MMKKEKIFLDVSILLNVIIVLMTILASIIMFTGINIMNNKEIILESTSLGMFKFFTVQSNLLMGIVSLIYIIKQINLLNKKIVKLPSWCSILKLTSTTAVTLTFVVVFLYLAPLTGKGVKPLLMNSNLFFHLLIPILSIITFIFFERNKDIKFKDNLISIIPVALYELFYLINALIHMENHRISPKYDWYYFVQTDIKNIYIVIPTMLIITYIISVILWYINKKR